jgi:hypothetical protein
MQTVKFADRLNAIASNADLNSKRRFIDTNVPLSPIQAAAQSEHHAALLKSQGVSKSQGKVAGMTRYTVS